MKKFVLYLLLCFLYCFAGCAPKKQPAFTPNPTATSSAENTVLVENITFRRGENADGEVLFTGNALQEVSVYNADPSLADYGLLFIFTENGKQLLDQCSSELSQTGEKMSIWIGEEQIACATMSSPLNYGKMMVTGSGLFTKETATEARNKFYGIAPAPTPIPIISEEVLDEILQTATGTFSYELFESYVDDGLLERISGPYKNTEKTAITSAQTLIDLGTKEAPESYVFDDLAYDANHKYWYVSFKKDADAEISYVVILTSEGKTVTIYTLP